MASVKIRTNKSKSGVLTYYLAHYTNSKWVYENTGVKVDPTKLSKAALKEHNNFLNSLVSARQLQLNTSSYTHLLDTSSKKKEDFIQYYNDFLKTYTKKDIRMYSKALKKFVTFIGKPSIAFNEVTLNLCEDFSNYLVNDAGLSGETPSNYFRRIKAVLKRAVKQGIISYSPATEISIASRYADNLKKEVLTIEELRILHNTKCGNDEVKRAFLFSCFTGLGLAEIHVLTWRNISKSNHLKVARQKLIKGTTETQFIDLPLSEAAISLLGERKEIDALIFDLKNPRTKNDISPQAVRKNLLNWVKRAGIDKHITFYCGRHTFGVLAANTDASTITIARLLGHKNTRHTEKYVNHVESLKEKTIAKLPSL